jgi:hypothetical protein
MKDPGGDADAGSPGAKGKSWAAGTNGRHS